MTPSSDLFRFAKTEYSPPCSCKDKPCSNYPFWADVTKPDYDLPAKQSGGPSLWSQMLNTTSLRDIMDNKTVYTMAIHEIGHTQHINMGSSWRHEVQIGYDPLTDDAAGREYWTSPCAFNGPRYTDPAYNPNFAGVGTGVDTPECLIRPAPNSIYGMNTTNIMGYSMPFSWRLTNMWGSSKQNEGVDCLCGPEVARAFIPYKPPIGAETTMLPKENLIEIPRDLQPSEFWLVASDILSIDKEAKDINNNSTGYNTIAIRTRMSIDSMPAEAPDQHLYLTFFSRGHCDSRKIFGPGDGGILYVQWGPYALGTGGDYWKYDSCPVFIRKNLTSDIPPDDSENSYYTGNKVAIASFPTLNSRGDPQQFNGWIVTVVDEIRDTFNIGSLTYIGPQKGLRTAIKVRIENPAT